jgi:glycosyltransferase involved in cell wall biosynthesis
MVKLSVVIITFNEEKNIGRCLESVRNIADDVVVVDSFSSDNTKAICEKHHARFVEHRFEGHIEQKNWALKQANYPNILSLDADEAVSSEMEKAIIKIKSNWTHDGYFFNRLTRYCNKWIKHCGWYPDRKLRLWDSRKGRWTGVNPHDKFMMDGDARVTRAPGDILHYSFYSIEDHMNQVNKFSTIKAEHAFRRGERASCFKILIKPVFKFFRGYVLKFGMLDGFYGFVVCINSAHAEFLRYVKLKRLWRDN